LYIAMLACWRPTVPWQITAIGLPSILALGAPQAGPIQNVASQRTPL